METSQASTPIECQQTVDTVLLLCKAIPCPNGEQLRRYVLGQTAEQPEISFEDRGCDSSFSDEYLFAELLSKFTKLRPRVNTRDAAIGTFNTREHINKHVNRRLRYSSEHPDFPGVLSRMQKRVSSILAGDVKKSLQSIMDASYFGPGTVIGTKGNRTTLYDKVGVIPTCTAELAPYALALMNSSQLLTRCIISSDGPCSLLTADYTTVAGARLSFVPKNAKTDRAITVEPLLNSFIQNGIGKFMRRRLMLASSLRLDDQSRNARAAKTAASQGWATIDLKDASNSLTSLFVFTALRKAKGWFELLNLTRSRRYILDGEVHDFQLFAGMGNGFTFPLESMLFYCLIKSYMESVGDYRDPLVYGDDLICPTEHVERLAVLFDHYGFSFNMKKTHYNSPFRESCGAHFFNGTSVIPLYLRNPLSDHFEAFKLHNALWRWATQDGFSFDGRVVPVMEHLRKSFRGPVVHPSLGDVGYFPCKSIRTKSGLKKWEVWTPKSEPPFAYVGSRGYWCSLHQCLQRAGTTTLVEGDLPFKKVASRSEDSTRGTRRTLIKRVGTRKAHIISSDFQFNFVWSYDPYCTFAVDSYVE